MPTFDRLHVSHSVAKQNAQSILHDNHKYQTKLELFCYLVHELNKQG